jgi:hypothetical protein
MIITILLGSKTIAQSVFQRISHLNYPEKVWVATHPFIALKSLKISNEASKIAAEAINDIEMDGDYSGGQVDAFRHALWMAMLVQEISPKKAYKLGFAHEKGNKIDFKKKKLEEGRLPDSVSCEMDLKNNNVGLEIGKIHKNATTKELQIIVKQAVLDGQCYKIKKDKDRNFLDENDNIIPESEWIGKWINPKIIVDSGYKKME